MVTTTLQQHRRSVCRARRVNMAPVALPRHAAIVLQAGTTHTLGKATQPRVVLCAKVVRLTQDLPSVTRSINARVQRVSVKLARIAPWRTSETSPAQILPAILTMRITRMPTCNLYVWHAPRVNIADPMILPNRASAAVSGRRLSAQVAPARG